MSKLTYMFAAAVLLSFSMGNVSAQNTPCSGRKGGISHCEGDTFVCNDGSASASKRSCPSYMGSSIQPLRATQPAATNFACSCSSRSYCTGPRGGTYCVTSGGSKRYIRK